MAADRINTTRKSLVDPATAAAADVRIKDSYESFMSGTFQSIGEPLNSLLLFFSAKTLNSDNGGGGELLFTIC